MSQKFQAIRAALSQRFLERNHVIDGLLVSLLSKEPLLMVGPPGTAKSELCRAASDAVNGNYFQWLLSKFTTPEELFGPYSLSGLKNDKYQRVTKGKMPEADVVFIDEVGKASSAISNTLLSMMNERIFFNDGQAHKVPIQTFFGATNELPHGEELGAFYDRFVLRYMVDIVREERHARILFQGFPSVVVPQITVKELEACQQAAAGTLMSDAIIDTLLQIRAAVAKAEIFVSDRKWVQITRVLKSYAYLNGNTEVTQDELEILASVLWSRPDQIPEVKKLVSRMINPINEKVLEIVDAVHELKDKHEKNQIDDVEFFKKVKAAKAELQKLKAQATTPSAKLNDAVQHVTDVLNIVATKVLQ